MSPNKRACTSTGPVTQFVTVSVAVVSSFGADVAGVAVSWTCFLFGWLLMTSSLTRHLTCGVSLVCLLCVVVLCLFACCLVGWLGAYARKNARGGGVETTSPTMDASRWNGTMSTQPGARTRPRPVGGVVGSKKQGQRVFLHSSVCSSPPVNHLKLLLTTTACMVAFCHFLFVCCWIQFCLATVRTRVPVRLLPCHKVIIGCCCFCCDLALVGV